MWRQRRGRARGLIVKELKSKYPAMCALDWTELNSMSKPPVGVGLVTSWLYYLVYLAKDDEANEYYDLNRLATIPYKEIKKVMLLPNYYKFLIKYDLFVDDILPKLSDDHMSKIVEFWKIESSRQTFLASRNNSVSVTGVWITSANVVTGMSQMVNWKDYILSYEEKYDKGQNIYQSQPSNQFYDEKMESYVSKDQDVHNRENEILKLESEMCEYRVQEELNNERREKLEEFEKKRSLLLKDLQRISQEYSFIETQIGELQKEEHELLKESENLENSNARSKIWYPKIKDEFTAKMQQVVKLKEECFRIRTEMDKKKTMIEESVHGEYNEEYQKSLNECKTVEIGLRQKKDALYEQLKQLK